MVSVGLPGCVSTNSQEDPQLPGWVSTSSEEDRQAKRRRVENALLRPGVGIGNHMLRGLGAVPAQPNYEAIPQTTAELMDIILKANFATVIGQHMQGAENPSYAYDMPQRVTAEWVNEHVREVFMDDPAALAQLKKSVNSHAPLDKLNKLLAYQPDKKNLLWI